MHDAIHTAAERLERFARERIAPLVYPFRQPLDVEVWQTNDLVSSAAASGAEFRPIQAPWSWGPVWSSAWFRLRRSGVSKELASSERAAQCRLFLRFSSGTEAILWHCGEPIHGLDVNHELAPLPHELAESSRIELLVEAACRRPLGATTFFWDNAEEVERWKRPSPGLFGLAEIVRVDERAQRLLVTLNFAAALLRTLDPASSQAASLAAVFQRLCDKHEGVTGQTHILGISEDLCGLLKRSHDDGASVCHAVGHAHIDTAWLWDTRHTRRKCLATFSTALNLLADNPGFQFVCSQPQQYAWVESDSPALFRRIKQAVQSGRWGPVGAMWVEPDCNIPSGESLIRQILHGMRSWREWFGEAAPQRALYLPDTFGFPASLPQIIRQAGLDTFILNKLSWNDTNPFPHTTFLWEGVDGTHVLSHAMPGMEYNFTMTPTELRKGDANHRAKDAGRTRAWLQPFGYGDGGGGPTQAMIDSARFADECEGMPRVGLSSFARFCEELHSQSPSAQTPVWNEELYLERHRGTYTTQARIKKANLDAEEQLRIAECLASAGPRPLPAAERKSVEQALDEAWKCVLLNQFHDILPGTSIGEVYDEARRAYVQVNRSIDPIVRHGVSAWLDGAPSNAASAAGRSAVFNPASTTRSGVLESGDSLAFVASAPAFGLAPSSDQLPQGTIPATVSADGCRLSNGILDADIDESGCISRLVKRGGDGIAGWNAAEAAPLNRLVLHDDPAANWEAWDIEEAMLARSRPATGSVAGRRVVHHGPLRTAIEIERPLGSSSRIWQTYSLDAGAHRLDIRTRIDWRERRTLLRALFPTSIASRHVTCGIQFGHIQRPAHADDSHARAKFEFCVHRWMDLSEPGRGLALLTRAKYGHSCRGGVIGLSLLRGTQFPDPEADQGIHEFIYSLMPHDGDWRAAGVDREAEALNRPLHVLESDHLHDRRISGTWAPFTLSVERPPPQATHVEIAAIKPAEDGRRIIVRLVEVRGHEAMIKLAWNLPVAAVESVDLLERPRPIERLTHDRRTRTTEASLKPFEIVTLAFDREDAG